MPDNKCRWKPKFVIGYKCNEPPLPNDPHSYCILHSKNDDKDLEAFKEKVKERLEKGNKKIDLSGCYFPKNFPGGYFGGHTFDKPVNFSEATFSQEADFYWATFSQKADFREAKFSQRANFRGAKFSQEANFIGATFSQVAYFGGATFSQADFGGATFPHAADFRGATFSQAGFFMAKFEQKADFSRAKFSLADFSGATFSQEADFSHVKFMGRTLFQYIHIPGEIIFQDVDLSRCSFLHSNIDKVDFRYCTFGVKKNRPFRIMRVFLLKCVKALLGEIKPQVLRIIRRYILAVTPFLRQNVLRDELECDKEVAQEGEDREKYEHVRRVYLELKRDFEDKKDWNTAGDFHFGEMECRRKMKGWFGRYFSLEAFYCWASGYGERPRRAFLILSALVFMVFPLLYMYFEGKDFYTSVGYSFKASTLMRFGSVELKNNLSEFFSGLEFILIPTQTALLALALRRKVKR